jgi:hypothetical protein
VFFLILLAIGIRYIVLGKILFSIQLYFRGLDNIYFTQLSNYFAVFEFSIFNFGFIRRVVVVVLFIIINKEKKINNCFFNLYLIGTLLYILFMGNDIAAHRFSLCFDVFMIPLFADITIKWNYKNIAIVSLFLLLCFVLYTITINAKGYVVPYQTYLLI